MVWKAQSSHVIVSIVGWAFGFFTFLFLNTPSKCPISTTYVIEGTNKVLPIESTMVSKDINQTVGSVTVVGVWFKLDKAKHGNGDYIQWAKNYFALQCDMVIW
jgi:hypothetical protein